MAWIVWRGRGARKVATVRWLDPKTKVERALALGTDDPHVARLAKARIEAEVERRAPRLPPLMGEDLLDSWIADRKARGHVGESTEDYYRGKVGPFLRAHPSLPVARLTARHVEVWIAAHPEWKPRTVQAFLVSLGSMLAWAKKAGQLVPAGLVEEVRAIERPPIRLIDRNVLTPAQVAALLAAARGTDLEPAVALAAGAGLGLGDLRTLRWGEVDLKAGTLHRPAGRRKTGERYRVFLAPFVVEALGRVKPRGETVCSLPPMRTLRKRFDDLHAAAGVPRGRGDGWHRLRHTFASMLAAAGTPLPAIRALLGHAPGSTATLRYLHPEDARIRNGAGRGVGREGSSFFFHLPSERLGYAPMTTTTQHTSRSVRKRAKAIVVRECAVRGGITRLAKAIGVGVPTVHRWARGETLPYAYHARLILERLA